MNKRKATAHTAGGGDATNKRSLPRTDEQQPKYVPFVTEIGCDIEEDDEWDSDADGR